MTKRICELLTGDVFHLWGQWQKVLRIESGRIFFFTIDYSSGYDSVGARSQQFVTIKSIANDTNGTIHRH